MVKHKHMDLPIEGMHCASCVLSVNKTFGKIEGVEEVDADLASNKLHITVDTKKISYEEMERLVKNLGFDLHCDEMTIRIQGMHCASCVNNVERFLPRIDGVIEANANLSNQKVTIQYYRDMLDLKEIKKTIEMLGFEYLGLDGEMDIMDEEERYQKDLRGKLYRIIVGLVFAGILMAIMQLHIMVPPLTMGQLSLIIAIFPFCYVSLPIRDYSILERISYTLSSNNNSISSRRDVKKLLDEFFASYFNGAYNYKDYHYSFIEINQLNGEVLSSNGDFNDYDEVSVSIRNYGNYSYKLYIFKE